MTTTSLSRMLHAAEANLPAIYDIQCHYTALIGLNLCLITKTEACRKTACVGVEKHLRAAYNAPAVAAVPLCGWGDQVIMADLTALMIDSCTFPLHTHPSNPAAFTPRTLKILPIPAPHVRASAPAADQWASGFCWLPDGESIRLPWCWCADAFYYYTESYWQIVLLVAPKIISWAMKFCAQSFFHLAPNHVTAVATATNQPNLHSTATSWSAFLPLFC